MIKGRCCKLRKTINLSETFLWCRMPGGVYYIKDVDKKSKLINIQDLKIITFNEYKKHFLTLSKAKSEQCMKKDKRLGSR